MLALTFDHRAVDGAYATRCVVRIKQLLESWDAAAYG
jgi:pyruvate/2-oxoglutarate dehydrogenase complex dihydrolipoamide acyltransferase (E2) component